MVMAQIYTLLGQYDLAIDELSYALSIPSWSSSRYLLADPLYIPLHNNQRFQSMLASYGAK